MGPREIVVSTMLPTYFSHRPEPIVKPSGLPRSHVGLGFWDLVTTFSSLSLDELEYYATEQRFGLRTLHFGL